MTSWIHTGYATPSHPSLVVTNRCTAREDRPVFGRKKWRRVELITVYVVSFAVAVSIVVDYSVTTKPGTAPAATVSSTLANNTASGPPVPTALDVYQNYTKIAEQAARSPAAHDWAPDIAQYTVDPLRAQLTASVRNAAAQGILDAGTVRHSPQVVTQTPHSAQISDCIDTSDANITRNGAPLPRPHDFPTRIKLEANAQFVDGAWRIADIRYDSHGSC